MIASLDKSPGRWENTEKFQEIKSFAIQTIFCWWSHVVHGLTQPNIADSHVSIYKHALIPVQVKQMVISQQPTRAYWEVSPHAGWFIGKWNIKKQQKQNQTGQADKNKEINKEISQGLRN